MDDKGFVDLRRMTVSLLVSSVLDVGWSMRFGVPTYIFERRTIGPLFALADLGL